MTWVFGSEVKHKAQHHSEQFFSARPSPALHSELFCAPPLLPEQEAVCTVHLVSHQTFNQFPCDLYGLGANGIHVLQRESSKRHAAVISRVVPLVWQGEISPLVGIGP